MRPKKHFRSYSLRKTKKQHHYTQQDFLIKKLKKLRRRIHPAAGSAPQREAWHSVLTERSSENNKCTTFFNAIHFTLNKVCLYDSWWGSGVTGLLIFVLYGHQVQAFPHPADGSSTFPWDTRACVRSQTTLLRSWNPHNRDPNNMCVLFCQVDKGGTEKWKPMKI